jgi:hypothetical protein
MDVTDFIQIGGFVITAGALIFTVRSFHKQLQMTFFADYTKRYQEILLNFPESINEENFDFNNLSDEVKSNTLRYMRAYFDLCSEEYYLSKSGDIDKRTWAEWEEGIRYAFSKKAFRDGWLKIKLDTIYYEDFSKFANKCISDSQ